MMDTVRGTVEATLATAGITRRKKKNSSFEKNVQAAILFEFVAKFDVFQLKFAIF
jgi:hypothetical protein